MPFTAFGETRDYWSYITVEGVDYEVGANLGLETPHGPTFDKVVAFDMEAGDYVDEAPSVFKYLVDNSSDKWEETYEEQKGMY